jgi:hypothetical protein
MTILSPCTSSAWSVIQEPNPARELRICTAPARDPCLDAQEVEVATREIGPDLSDVAVLDGPQSVLGNRSFHRRLPACPVAQTSATRRATKLDSSPC